MHDLRAVGPEVLLKKGRENSIYSMIISTFIAFIIILASAAISGSGAALFFFFIYFCCRASFLFYCSAWSKE